MTIAKPPSGVPKLPGQLTINARGRVISLDTPVIMGILNLTPDSFYSGSRIGNIEDAVNRTEQMRAEGAVMVDVGAASSRPGSEVVGVKEELQRLMPVLEALLAKFPDVIFSVDTWRSEVAQAALSAGAHVINDITAGIVEPDIVKITAGFHAPFIAMHMLGTPGNMPAHPQYGDVAGDILRFFTRRIRDLQEAGLSDVILDPGFGFGKSVDNNFALLRKLEIFQFLEFPLMVGLSRKSMIWRTLNVPAEDALNGTTALHMIALQKGANILRVHDVRAAKEAISLHQKYLDT